MDAREVLRSRSRFDEILPSGLTVTIRLPRIRDCIIAGQVPLPILSHLVEVATSQNGSTPDVTAEEAAHMARFQDEIVRRSIIAIEGEPIEMTLEDLPDIAQEDYDHIVSLAMRERTSPKVDSQTSG